jgi:predicted RNase H-like nuclease (RuvC/YqgF family)
MPTQTQEIEELKKIVQKLQLENDALTRICTEQAKIIQRYQDQALDRKQRGL